MWYPSLNVYLAHISDAVNPNDELFSPFHPNKFMRMFHVLSETIQTDSPAFRNWFRNSKVVDQAGQPMVVYHGTDTEFDHFYGWSHFGTVAAANQRIADLETMSGFTPGYNMIPVYLSMQNPLMIEDNGFQDAQDMFVSIVQSNPQVFSKKQQDYLAGLMDTEGFDHTEVERLLRSKGYDGFMYHNAHEDEGSISYIVFTPNQVKSVFNKRTWNPDSPKMSESLVEATRPFQQKIVDPALMTYEEYYDLVNPGDKFHPSTAYDSDVDQLNQYQSPQDYQKLLNTITRNGLQFEVREQAKDRWEGNYLKMTPEDEPLRDESNQLVYMSREEVQQMIPEERRYAYEYAVVEKKTGQIVGNTQDEWGTLLVMVAAEFRKFGFGTLLVKLARERNPKRNSGGFTSGGAANLRRVHAAWVREYLESGFYSHLVKTKQITLAQVKAITASVTVKRPVQTQQKNLDTTNPSDWLLMSDGQSFAIIYDKKIYEVDEPDWHENQWLIDRHIIAMASLSDYGTGSPPMVNRVYGINDQVKAQVLEVLMNQMVGHYIRMYDEEAELLRAKMGRAFQVEPPVKTGDYPKYYTNRETEDWRRPARIEKAYRKRFDPYDEWYARIIDWAETLGNPD